MPHRESRFTVNLVLVIISERSGAYSAGFVRIPLFLSQKQRAITRNTRTKDVRPIDEVNTMMNPAGTRFMQISIFSHGLIMVQRCVKLRC